MAILLANNATGKLAGAITAAATTITLQSGQGALFPSPSGGDYFPLTLVDSAGLIEITKCTARSGDILTVTRAQEGTTAKAYAAGSRASLRVTDGVFDYVFNVIDNALLKSFLAQTTSADKMTYYTAANTAAIAPLTAFARSILDDADAATVRSTIGAQASDATLTAIAGLTGAADRLPYFNGADTAALATFTAFARSLLDDADASTALTTLGVSAFAKTILDDADAAAVRTTIGLGDSATKNVGTAAGTVADGSYAVQGVNSSRTTIESSSADAITKSGFYSLYPAATGNPYAGLWVMLTHIEHVQQNGYAVQFAMPVGTTALFKMRKKHSGSWYAWADAWTADSLPVSAFIKTLLEDADAATARATIGAQASDPTLTAIAGLTGAADRLPYFNGADTAALATFTAFARSLLDDADAAAARATLSVLSTDEPYKSAADVATTANLTATYANGSSGVGATLTNSGTLAALTLDGVAVTAGMRVLVKDQNTVAQNGIYTVTNIGSASVAWVLTRATDADTPSRLSGAIVTVDQGTANGAGLFTNDFKKTYVIGANVMNWRSVWDSGNLPVSTFAKTILDDSDAAAVRTTIGAQASDATLTALAGLTGAADRLPYFNGADTATLATLTAFARTLLDDADAATARTTLGAQASDATLTALSGLTTAADKIPYFTAADTASVATFTAFARSLLDDANAPAACATLGAAQLSMFGFVQGTNGYIKIPRSDSGYIYIQWGKVSAMAANATAPVTFPTAFPGACDNIIATPLNTVNTASMVAHPDSGSITTTGFTMRGDADNANTGVFWVAIGR